MAACAVEDRMTLPSPHIGCFLLLSANYSTYLSRQRLCSRLTALWRYINFILLLLLILHRFTGVSEVLRRGGTDVIG